MRGWEGEEGAVAVTVALLLVVLFLMAGFVLDLGLARFDRHANQTAADLAATAAVQGLDQDAADAYEAACQRAVDYFLANNRDAAPVTGDPCAIFADASFTCSSVATATTATVLAEPYELYVTVPVLDDDPLLDGQILNRDVDGYDPCGRVGIRVVRERDHLFAGIIGSGSSRPTSDAVARTTADGTDPEYATLVVLAPQACQVVTGNGNNVMLLVEDIDENVVGDANDDGELDVFPGIVTLDSDGSECSSGKYLVNPNGDANRICAGVQNTADVLNSGAFCASTPDTLLSEAVAAVVAKPADLTAQRVAPEPVRRGRITRQPIDHRYNCRSEYYPATASAQLPIDWGGTPVQTCGTSASRPAHIDGLVAAYVGKSQVQMEALGFTTISGGTDCKPNDTRTYPPGDYYVNCTSGQGYKVGGSVTFTGPGTIVFAGDVNVNGSLTVNGAAEFDDDTAPAADLDTTVVLQNGTFSDTGGAASSSTRLFRTFLYVHDGVINLQKSVTWEAPRDNPYDRYDSSGGLIEAGPCDQGEYAGAPPPDCFQNLALWSNSSEKHDLAAQAGISLDGIFFTPHAGYAGSSAAFVLHGGPGYVLEHAQFFTYELELTGGSKLTMRPDPNRFEATPVIGGGLIR